MMKYKVKTKINTETNSGKAINSLTPSQFLSNSDPVNAATAIALNIAQSNFFGSLSVKGSPWLLRNILSSVYITLLNLVVRYGTISMVVHDKIKSITVLFRSSPKSIVRKKLKLIPNQNIRFQKLSLFCRALSQFMGLIKSLNMAYILTCLKIFRKLFLYIAITFFASSHIATANSDYKEIISNLEEKYNIPIGLLQAIVKVESGMKPYAINVQGMPYFAKSMEDAKEIIKQNTDRGITNIDVGLAQVNLRWHGKNFADLTQIIEPQSNLTYAAKLLTDLYSQHKCWHKAVRIYHSGNPVYYKKYSRKILITWLNS